MDLTSLPPLALIALGVTLAVIFAATRLGLIQGSKSAPTGSSGGAQVAAVIVDPSALNRATAALEAFNITLTETNFVGREMLRVQSATADELDRIREEMRIQREVNRR